MYSFFRLTRATGQTVMRTVVKGNAMNSGNSSVLANKAVLGFDSLSNNEGSAHFHPSRFLENSTFSAKYDSSTKVNSV